MYTTNRLWTASLPLLVTRTALTEARIDLDVALRAAACGQWRDLLPGAWLRSQIDVTRDHLQQAALELLSPTAMLTGPDACAEYGLRDVPPDDRVNALVPHAMQRELGPAVRLIRTTGRPQSYVMRGRRWASPARAVLDASVGRDLREVRALVTAAVADVWVCPEELGRLLETGPRRGSAALRRALGDAEAGAGSAPEAEAADLLSGSVRREHLPRFLLNPDLFVAGELLLTPDLCWWAPVSWRAGQQPAPRQPVRAGRDPRPSRARGAGRGRARPPEPAAPAPRTRGLPRGAAAASGGHAGATRPGGRAARPAAPAATSPASLRELESKIVVDVRFAAGKWSVGHHDLVRAGRQGSQAPQEPQTPQHPVRRAGAPWRRRWPAPPCSPRSPPAPPRAPASAPPAAPAPR
jgi:hypothetical protein